MVQCTSGSLPAGIVADLRQVIQHHNAGGIYMPRYHPSVSHHSSRGQPRGNCFVVIATSPFHWFPTSIYSGYPGGDLPVLDGSQDEPSCPYCVFGPCIIRRPPVFLTGRAAPSLVNDRNQGKPTLGWVT